MTEPQFNHDCPYCNFQGRGDFEKHPVDWYICSAQTRDGLRTVIARYGNEGHEYASSTIGETVDPSPVVISALAHGLDLNATEQAKLFKSLLASYRRGLGMTFWSEFAPRSDGYNQIGTANWLGLDEA